MSRVVCFSGISCLCEALFLIDLFDGVVVRIYDGLSDVSFITEHSNYWTRPQCKQLLCSPSHTCKSSIEYLAAYQIPSNYWGSMGIGDVSLWLNQCIRPRTDQRYVCPGTWSCWLYCRPANEGGTWSFSIPFRVNNLLVIVDRKKEGVIHRPHVLWPIITNYLPNRGVVGKFK